MPSAETIGRARPRSEAGRGLQGPGGPEDGAAVATFLSLKFRAVTDHPRLLECSGSVEDRRGGRRPGSGPRAVPCRMHRRPTRARSARGFASGGEVEPAQSGATRATRSDPSCRRCSGEGRAGRQGIGRRGIAIGMSGCFDCGSPDLVGRSRRARSLTDQTYFSAEDRRAAPGPAGDRDGLDACGAASRRIAQDVDRPLAVEQGVVLGHDQVGADLRGGARDRAGGLAQVLDAHAAHRVALDDVEDVAVARDIEEFLRLVRRRGPAGGPAEVQRPLQVAAPQVDREQIAAGGELGDLIGDDQRGVGDRLARRLPPDELARAAVEPAKLAVARIVDQARRLLAADRQPGRTGVVRPIGTCQIGAPLAPSRA